MLSISKYLILNLKECVLLRPEIKIFDMKLTLITLFTSIAVSLTAQVPNWTQNTCDGNSYSMYAELSKGKAVLLNFSNIWSPGSGSTAEQTETIWQNMYNSNVKVFGFINEDQDFNTADCYDMDIWEATHGISFPTFINIENVLSTYINKYTEDGAVNLPWLLLFLPNENDPVNSTLVYSGNSISAVNHILHDQWLGQVGVPNLGVNDKNVVKILDQLGRETTFKTNTPLIYVYSDGSTKKIFSFE